MGLSLFIRPHPGHTAIGVCGDIDCRTSQWLQGCLLRMLGTAGTHLIVDLSAVSFIDCSGLRALLATCREAEARACSVRFTDLSHPVRRLADLTGQRKMIPMTWVPAVTGAPATPPRRGRGAPSHPAP
ncbi:MAG TPA: STAS domain-containing protein [Streptosporangiaceae bacterium]|jgi:anti-sigma B factor antagonist